MRKYLIPIVVLALGGILILRESFIHFELDELRNQLRSQMSQDLSSADSIDRLQNLSSAPEVYTRYLESVLLCSNRLLWPFSRESILHDWRREVHHSLDRLYLEQSQKIAGKAQEEIQSLKADSPASMNRLMKILAVKAKSFPENGLLDLVKEESSAISDAARLHDQELLREIQETGRQSLNTFKKRFSKMDFKALSKYFSSAKFLEEVEAPIVAKILELKQAELRQKTWAEFQLSLRKILLDRSQLLSKNSQRLQAELKASENQKRIQALFNSVAEAVKVEETDKPNLDTGSHLDYVP